MLGKPGDKELEEIVLHDMGAKDPTLHHKIIWSWEKVHTKGIELRKRSVDKIPYQQWILERVKIFKLLLSIEIPTRHASPGLALISLEEVDEIRAKVARLEK